MEKLLVDVWPAGGEALSLGRSKMFELVASGELPSVRIGRRRLLRASDLRAYAESLTG